MKHILLAFALLLAGCDALSGSDMPNVDDPDAIRAALVAQNPIAPHGKENKSGVYGMGQPGSDRYLLTERFRRWVDDEMMRRYTIDYQTAPLPSSIAAAIEEQRVYEAEHQARSDARISARKAEEAAIEARRHSEALADEAARNAQAAAQEQQMAENEARYEKRMDEYLECVRLRQLPDSPEARGEYPEQDCEHWRDIE